MVKSILISHSTKQAICFSLGLLFCLFMALAEFFQTDPRVLKHGVVSAIIAQQPNDHKKSIRCEETVKPLANALDLEIIKRFRYGEVRKLAQWLKTSNKWNGQSVLISAQHLDIVNLAQALGVQNILQAVWPHETYDRVWILDFSLDGSLTRFHDIEQRLLFGDSYQTVEPDVKMGRVKFSESYREQLNSDITTSAKAVWSTQITATIPGDFSEFDDNTVPVLRVGWLTFGYYATSLGKIKGLPNVKVETQPKQGSGSLRYAYCTILDGVKHPYAWVYFSWNSRRLRIEFNAQVDGPVITPEIDMPVQPHQKRPEGLVHGAVNVYVGFGNQCFHAPAGLSYSGVANRVSTASGDEIYHFTVSANGSGLLPRSVSPRC